MKTLLAKKEIEQFISKYIGFDYAWSCRGNSSGKITVHGSDNVYRETGCGYDRFGSLLGKMIVDLLPKSKDLYFVNAQEFYGINMNLNGEIKINGACGDQSMRKILAACGIEIKQYKETDNGQSGVNYFTFIKSEKTYLSERIKEIKTNSIVEMNKNEFKALIAEKSLKIKDVSNIFNVSVSSIYKYNLTGKYPLSLIAAIKAKY